MSKPEPIAVLCSDIHLQEKPPIARSAETDWWKAMQRPVDQLKALAKKHKVPVVCAGDVFNHWKAPPELVNWALEHLPTMYAVPGQHDLPFHSYEEMDRSAYGTLVRFGKIIDLPYFKPTRVHPGLVLWGFPWNHKLKPCPLPMKDDEVRLAVVHAYCWQKGADYPGAKEEQRAAAHASKLKGFHTAVFGDNHKPFLAQKEGRTIFNHGGFMRRKSDEYDHRPAFGLLMSDGSVDRVFQDVEADLFIDRAAAKFEEGDEFQMQAFLKELSNLGGSELDFRDAVSHYLRTYEVSEGAKQIIIKALEQ